MEGQAFASTCAPARPAYPPLWAGLGHGHLLDSQRSLSQPTEVLRKGNRRQLLWGRWEQGRWKAPASLLGCSGLGAAH